MEGNIMKTAIVMMPPREKYAMSKIVPYLPIDTQIVSGVGRPQSDTHEAAWRAVAGSDFGAVFHDDIILCDNFLSNFIARVEDGQDRGHKFMSFYNPRKSARIDMEKGLTWSRLAPSSFLAEECVVMEGTLLDEYNKWAVHNPIANRKWHDEQLQNFLRYKKERVWICVPNLVNHSIEIPSLLGHSPVCWGKPRVSSTWRIDAQ
jgi:hypothetical protein